VNNKKLSRILFTFLASGYRLNWDRFNTIIELLREKGFDVWVLGYAQNWSSIKRKILGSIDIDLKNKIINITQPRWLSTIEYYSTYNLVFIMGIGYAVLLYKVCKNLKINTVVLADDMVGINFYFLLIKKIFRMKMNTIIDYADLRARWHTFKGKNILMRIISTTIDEVINPKLAKKIITITNFGKEFLFHRSKINKGYVIPLISKFSFELNLNIDRKEVKKLLGLDPKYFIFIWCGHLGGFTTYDVLFLIKGISMSKYRDNIQLVLAASASNHDINHIYSYAKRLNVNVKYIGYLDKKTLMKYLQASDVGVFIRPQTLFTHFLSGTKVYDYMLAGLPVIVPCLKGQLETIKGNGLCYKPGNVKDLAMKIDKILEMNLEYMGAVSREIAKNNLKYVTELINQKEFMDFLTNHE
jgi:glycosyltransferase involved in cell wall biosynthesis